jgi:hypothetical protein
VAVCNVDPFDHEYVYGDVPPDAVIVAGTVPPLHNGSVKLTLAANVLLILMILNVVVAGHVPLLVAV